MRAVLGFLVYEREPHTSQSSMQIDPTIASHAVRPKSRAHTTKPIKPVHKHFGSSDILGLAMLGLFLLSRTETDCPKEIKCKQSKMNQCSSGSSSDEGSRSGWSHGRKHIKYKRSPHLSPLRPRRETVKGAVEFLLKGAPSNRLARELS